MVTQEQKNAVRSLLADTVESLPGEIEKEITKVGGRDMLIQRIDVLFWVWSAEDDLKIYREALRILDGAEEIDESLIGDAIERKKDFYLETLKEIESLREEIREKQDRLRRNEEMLPQFRLSAEVLEQALSEYRRKGSEA